jgi:peptidoglycan/xylan/chitin deacetylase (PgdA/CDA1 family)
MKGLLSGLGTILMLHRVEPLNNCEFAPNKDMSVSLEFLEKFILGAQNRGYTFISLNELTDKLLMGAKNKYLTLTFDDGYKDNFTTAYPLLNRLGIPFTIYATSSFLEGDAILWWYALEQMLLDNDSIEMADGRILLCRSTQEKLDAFVSLRKSIMSLPCDSLGESINAMFADIKFDWRQICAREALGWDDLAKLAQDPLVTIGAHTVTHPVLSKLPQEDACAEMDIGRKLIEEHIHRPVEHFCYPFGSREEVGVREFQLARELGFKSATTTRWGNIFNKHRLHLHALPRVPLINGFNWNDFHRNSLRRFLRGRVVTA